MKPKLGAHVSKAGGLMKAIENAKSIGAETIQIHATSPRMWKITLPKEDEADEFKKIINEMDMPVYIHAPYLINLASNDSRIYDNSFENLKGNLIIGNMIGAKGVVYHLGSSKGWDKDKAIKQQADAVRQILKEVGGDCQIVLENAAGGGDKIGANFDELSTLFNLIKSKDISICLDTAHSFEAGMIEHYTTDEIKEFFDRFDKKIGLKNLTCFHVNDSKTEFNSQHDRHENLGDGYIGIQAFKNLSKEKRLYHCDWILEVPGDGEGPTKKQMNKLKSLF